MILITCIMSILDKGLSLGFRFSGKMDHCSLALSNSSRQSVLRVFFNVVTQNVSVRLYWKVAHLFDQDSHKWNLCLVDGIRHIHYNMALNMWLVALIRMRLILAERSVTRSSNTTAHGRCPQGPIPAGITVVSENLMVLGSSGNEGTQMILFSMSYIPLCPTQGGPFI